MGIQTMTVPICNAHLVKNGSRVPGTVKLGIGDSEWMLCQEHADKFGTMLSQVLDGQNESEGEPDEDREETEEEEEDGSETNSYDPNAAMKLYTSVVQEENRWNLRQSAEERAEERAEREKQEITRRAQRQFPPEPSETQKMRTWARAHGYEISARGRVPGDVRMAYEIAQEAAKAEQGPEVVITGAIDGYGAEEVRGAVEGLGYSIAGHITAETAYIIVGRRPAPHKIEEAETHDTSVINAASPGVLAQMIAEGELKPYGELPHITRTKRTA